MIGQTEGFKVNVHGIEHSLEVVPSLNVSTMKQLDEFRAHDSQITCMIQLIDGRVATCSHDSYVKIFTADDFEVAMKVKAHDNALMNLYQTTKGILLTSSCDTTIKMWEVKEEDLNFIGVLKGHTKWVMKAIEISDDVLASCSEDKTVKIWDINTKECTKTIEGFKGNCNNVHKMKNLNTLVVFSGDKVCTFFDIANEYKQLSKIDNVYCYLHNSLLEIDNDRLIIGGFNDITIIDCKQFSVITKLQDEYLSYVASILKVNTDEIIFGCYTKFYQVDLKTMKCIGKRDEVHDTVVTGMLCIENNKKLVSCSNRSIKIWGN